MEENIPEQLPSYKTVTEVFDWGPAISKVIIKWIEEIESEMVNNNSFKVYARRILAEGALSPSEAKKTVEVKVNLGSTSKKDSDLQGYREITSIYVSNERGNKQQKGNYITIEMTVYPKYALSSALNYDLNTRYNNYVRPYYTIIQTNPINNKNNFIIENYKGDIRPIVDKFKFCHKMNKFISIGYASYEPPNDGNKHPLIIWLHGYGEGGSDNPALPIMGNKANMFADESLQKYFGGAYVLAPQAPTYWMHGVKGYRDGTSTYEESVMGLITSYINEHSNLDSSRVYIGGDSNGGFMTMLLVKKYPNVFAAGFPDCGGIKKDTVTDEDIRNISKTPLWFVSCKKDTTVPPDEYITPIVERLKKIGADVHYSLYDDVHDTSGVYKQDDGKPYEYNGHFSWIYIYNDEVEEIIDGKKVKLMEWLASQKKESKI